MSRTPIESYHTVNGVRICLFEWPGEGRPLVFAHATGFHARVWDQTIARLEGRRALALDFRGHGRSDKPAPPYNWHDFGGDLSALMQKLGVEGAIGIGHSKGGHAVVNAGDQAPGTFAGLLLVDPVIMPREAYRNRTGGGEHFAARRRNEWASPQEMIDRFKDRPPFSGWDPAVLRDYCEYGLLPNPDGEGYVLACPPAIEASVYGMASGDDIYEAVARTTVPVTILRARQRGAPTDATSSDMSGSPTAPDLAQHFADAVDVPLPEHSHFIPMENPALIARSVVELEARIDGSA